MTQGQRGRPKKIVGNDYEIDMIGGHYHNDPDDSAALITDSGKEEHQEDAPVVENFTVESARSEEAPAPVLESESPAASVIDLNGWQLIEDAPRNGLPIFVSKAPDGNGTLAFWKRTRAFNGKLWHSIGKYVDSITGVDLPFEPLYWKPKHV